MTDERVRRKEREKNKRKRDTKVSLETFTAQYGTVGLDLDMFYF